MKQTEEKTPNSYYQSVNFNNSDWNKWLDRSSNKIIPIHEEEDYEGGEFDVSNLAQRYKLDKGDNSKIKIFKSKLDCINLIYSIQILQKQVKYLLIKDDDYCSKFK